MMRPMQVYSPSLGGIGNSTTTQSTASNGRPIEKTNSPQLGGRGLRLPRLAGSPASAVSHAGRRDSRTELNGTPTAKRNEDLETPVKAFLSSNITPRSSSRKARVDSASTTPTGTPDGTPRNSRPSSTIDRFGPGRDETSSIAGLGIRGGRTSRPRSLISDGGSSSLSFSLASSDPHGYTARNLGSESSPKFFHASDMSVKVSSKTSTQRVAPPVGTQSFQYANGEYEHEVNGSPLSISPPAEERQSKFFHSNAATESESSPFRFPNGRNSSRPILETIPSAQSVGGRQRSPSPLKNNPPSRPTQQRPSSPLKDGAITRKSSINKASPRRHTRLVSNGAAGELRSPVALAFNSSRRSSLSTPANNQPDLNLSRRSSLSTPSQRNTGHARSSSVNAVGSIPVRKSVTYSELSPTGYGESPPTDFKKDLLIDDQGFSIAGSTECPKSSPQAPFKVTQAEPPSPVPFPVPPSQPESPTKLTQPASGKSKIDQMNDLAASARRERKVLDLEISNSSLLAINQTLEREMRKQALEIRRFRRMSRRSGISNKRTTIGENQAQSGEDELSDDPSSAAYDDDFDSDLESTDATSLPESTLSPPSARTSSIPVATRVKKVVSKPLLDLSRQRALLIDSQKLNQSLKRCLGRTEEMITDAKRALEYKVNIEELESLGGRVLTPEEGWSERGRGLLSPSLEGAVREQNPWELVRGKDGEEQDKHDQGNQREASEHKLHEDDDLDSLDSATPSPQPHEDTGGKGLGRYLGSLGESLGL